ncbi:unnamed protein product [Ixodes pacificus]
MLKRIAHKSHGAKESELWRITEALVYTGIMYGLPLLRLNEHLFNRLNNLTGITLTTLGVPSYAASTFVESTAICNSLSERILVHQEAQGHRLTTSNQGRALLELLGHYIINLALRPPPAPPWDTLPYINVRPILKHMHPDRDTDRRASSSRRQIRTDPLYYHADASFNARKVVTASTDPSGHTIVNHHHDVPSVMTAEILAITQAITQHEHPSPTFTVRTDSQAALRVFLRNILLSLATTYTSRTDPTDNAIPPYPFT